METLTAAFLENLPLSRQEARAFAYFTDLCQTQGDNLFTFYQGLCRKGAPVGEIYPVLKRFADFCTAMGRPEAANALCSLPVHLLAEGERLQALRQAISSVDFSALRPVKEKKWLELAEIFNGPSLILREGAAGPYLRFYVPEEIGTLARKGDKFRLALDKNGKPIVLLAVKK